MARHSRIINLKGTDEFSRRLRQMADLSDLKEAVKNNTAELNRNSQRGAPVDTGYLRRSHQMSIENDGLSGHVNVMADYAQMVNDGTRHQAPQPFFTDAFYKQKIQFEKDLIRLL